MAVFGKHKNLYVDVDGTLINWPGDKPGVRNDGNPIANFELVQRLIEWKTERPERILVVWSANGAKHAEWAVNYVRLQDYVDYILPKPSGFIDDSYQWIKQREKITPWTEQEDDRKVLQTLEKFASGDGKKLTESFETIRGNINSSIRRGLRQIKQHPPNQLEACIVAGGPSLDDTFDELKELYYQDAKLIAVNGTYNYLIERNLRPSAMVMVDARESNTKFLEKEVPTCKYFLASQCHPKTFDICEGRDTYLWHGINNREEVELLDEFYQGNYFQIPGGSTVTLRAIYLMRFLGYQKLHLFGFDSCIMEGKDHSYEQPENDTDPRIVIECEGKRFICTDWHISQAYHFQSLIKNWGESFQLNVHGEGLISHMIRKGAELYVVEEENDN